MIRSVPRLILVAASGITIALAITLSAARDEPASALRTVALAKVEATKCLAEARAIERRAECGYVVVPLDRAEPGGKKLPI